MEVVVAILLLGLVTAGLFNGLGTASNVVLRNDMRQTTKNLAEYVMESVKNQGYQEVANPVYPVPNPLPSPQNLSYYATITVKTGTNTTVFNPGASPPQGRDLKLQKITVKIFKIGSIIPLYTLDGYKVE